MHITIDEYVPAFPEPEVVEEDVEEDDKMFCSTSSNDAWSWWLMVAPYLLGEVVVHGPKCR